MEALKKGPVLHLFVFSVTLGIVFYPELDGQQVFGFDLDHLFSLGFSCLI